MIALDAKATNARHPRKAHGVVDEESDNEGILEVENKNDATESEELESDDDVGGNESSDTDAQDASEDEGSETSRSGNPGWADAMQKILRMKKPKRKKTLVLSKAKKLCDIKKENKEELPFEIDGAEEKIKVEIGSDNKVAEQTPTQQKQRRKDHLGIRVKPSITDRERERILQKIATKGVVQLFNVVRQQQTEISKKLTEAGPLERKREKVLKSIDKRAFLDVLMGGSKSIQVDNDVKNESEDENTTKKKDTDNVWSVLRDDFVMGAKLKDWDKKEDEDQDSSAPEELDSDN